MYMYVRVCVCANQLFNSSKVIQSVPKIHHPPDSAVLKFLKQTNMCRIKSEKGEQSG